LAPAPPHPGLSPAPADTSSARSRSRRGPMRATRTAGGVAGSPRSRGPEGQQQGAGHGRKGSHWMMKSSEVRGI
jgi:hypothetical protein